MALVVCAVCFFTVFSLTAAPSNTMITKKNHQQVTDDLKTMTFKEIGESLLFDDELRGVDFIEFHFPM